MATMRWLQRYWAKEVSRNTVFSLPKDATSIVSGVSKIVTTGLMTVMSEPVRDFRGNS